MTVIPEHAYDPNCEYAKRGCCYWCCDRCDKDRHQCGGCAEELDHNGNELRTGKKHGDCTS